MNWVRQALLLDPDNLNMRYNLACTIIRQLGDIDETLKTLEPFFERINSTTLMRHMDVDPDFQARNQVIPCGNARRVIRSEMWRKESRDQGSCLSVVLTR
jgi:hypothetical protein